MPASGWRVASVRQQRKRSGARGQALQRHCGVNRLKAFRPFVAVVAVQPVTGPDVAGVKTWAGHTNNSELREVAAQPSWLAGAWGLASLAAGSPYVLSSGGYGMYVQLS